jgi:hypothetical protein
MNGPSVKAVGSIEVNMKFRQFIALVKDMFSRPEYLFPYVWAQRQFRSDSYQMASASQLEDLFYDTFGTFLRQESLEKTWDRRVGKEKWDFQFEKTGISHKEGLQPIITAFWTAGKGDGYRTPTQPTWDFEHAVTFTYTPLNVPIKASFLMAGKVEKIKVRQVNHKTIDGCKESSLIGLGHIEGRSLEIVQTWTLKQWNELTIHEVRRILAGRSLLEFDFWIIDARPVVQEFIQDSRGDIELEMLDVPLLPGIYFLEKHLLQGVHLTSNNRAHMVSSGELVQVMNQTSKSELFVRLPLWPGIYADMRPANLYAMQRRQFDEMIAPRE